MMIEQFCDRHTACKAGRRWALAHCANMAEVWATAKAIWLIWIARRPGVLDDRTKRRFTCFCARQIWHRLVDARSRRAVEVAERYADGVATADELAVARDAAAVAVMNASTAAGRHAARFTTRNTALDAAWHAARVAYDTTVMDHTEIAWCTERDGQDAQAAAQVAWLRAHAQPNFEGEDA